MLEASIGERLAPILLGFPLHGRDGGRSQRKAVGEVVPVPASQSDLGAVTPSQYSKAVVLDLMNPVGPDGGVLADRGRHGSILPEEGRRIRGRNNGMDGT